MIPPDSKQLLNSFLQNFGKSVYFFLYVFILLTLQAFIPIDFATPVYYFLIWSKKKSDLEIFLSQTLLIYLFLIFGSR